jgi:anti-sigma regulatory factor (Ser/Thr protein kinase)
VSQAVSGEDRRSSLVSKPVAVSAAYEGGESIAEARALARAFLTDVQSVHGLPVSERAMGMVQLVVSELVTNVHKYAPGPYMLTLEVREGAVEVTVWDSEPAPPETRAADPDRLGQHGMEIVMAVCRTLEVHREPVGKRIKATVVLADDPGGDVVGHLM